MTEGLRHLARNVEPSIRQNWIEPDPDPGRGPGHEAEGPLEQAERLRRDHPEWSPDLAAAIAGQRELIHRGRTSGQIPPVPWLATRTGLEQSTRPPVALRRARILASTGISSMVDLTAGLGVDSWAATEVGLQIVAVERDPLTADLCRANVPGVDVHEGDAQAVAAHPDDFLAKLRGPTCWFVDPSRRGSAQRSDGLRSAPERDPHRWSPPWSFVEELIKQGRYVAAKAPGGFTPAEHWAVEWVGLGDYVVECAAYSLPGPPLTFHRQATLLEDDRTLTFEVSDQSAPVGPLQEFLAEPHPVFHRALSAVCEQGLWAVHVDSTFLTADAPIGQGVRWFRVLATTPINRTRDALRDLGISAAAIKSRESRTLLATLRKKFRVADGNHYAIVLARGLNEAIIVERVSPQSR